MLSLQNEIIRVFLINVCLLLTTIPLAVLMMFSGGSHEPEINKMKELINFQSMWAKIHGPVPRPRSYSEEHPTFLTSFGQLSDILSHLCEVQNHLQIEESLLKIIVY